MIKMRFFIFQDINQIRSSKIGANTYNNSFFFSAKNQSIDRKRGFELLKNAKIREKVIKR